MTTEKRQKLVVQLLQYMKVGITPLLYHRQSLIALKWVCAY